MPGWTFLSNYAQVLLCIAHDPGIRLRDIAASVGITERGAHKILSALVEEGYVQRERVGRRNRYTISHNLPLPDRLARNQKIGDLLEILTTPTGDAT